MRTLSLLWMTLLVASLCALHARAELEDSEPYEFKVKNPCNAAGSMGDIALNDEEYAALIKRRADMVDEVDAALKKVKVDAAEGSLTPEEKGRRVGELKKARERLMGDDSSTRGDIERERRREWRRRRRLQCRALALTRRGRQRCSARRRTGDRRRSRRAATGKQDRLWKNGIIPFDIDANFTGQNRAMFKKAMLHWEANTCVTFVAFDAKKHRNHILFTERACGCCSFVGKSEDGTQQEVSIGKNCDKFGIVVHELGHVVGFWHEHTRPDRDKYIDIVKENIQSGQEYNFEDRTKAEVNSLDEEYDYRSIMHYAHNTFSKGPSLPTIKPKNRTHVEIGQRLALSEGDIRQANKLYSCPSCGGTFQTPTGELSSPPHAPFIPRPASELCRWRIRASAGEHIHLNVTSLKVKATEGCETDYLLVGSGHYDPSKDLLGPTETNSVIGRYCGSAAPPMIISTDNRLWVEYKTSVGSTHRGFNALYEAVCGGSIVAESGVIASPSYPEDYRPDKDCVWKITVPEGFQVALQFDLFEVEDHDYCIYDYVEVRDGHSADSPLIGSKLCSYQTPPDIVSTSNKLYVRFVSDSSVQKAGFSAKFTKEFDECDAGKDGCEHDCLNRLGDYICTCRIGYELHTDGKHCEDACGGHYDTTAPGMNSTGVVQSPSFPSNYPMNKNCIWKVIAPTNYRITINFTDFDLEGNNNDCEYDSVEVKSLVGDQSVKHGQFCGAKLPLSITSEGHTLLIEFNSDSTVQRRGFRAVYFTDKDECANANGGCQHNCRNTIGSYECSCYNGFTLHANGHDCKEGGCNHEVRSPEGNVQSPNYPDMYPSRKNCVWRIFARPGHRVKLVFEVFELEPHEDCAYDKVTLHDGKNTRSRSLGTFCGSSLPGPIVANGDSLHLSFSSDASVQRRGFKATHSTVCGGTWRPTETPQKLFSHSRYGDQQYKNKESCNWRFDVPEGKQVKLEFHSFEVEAEIECGYDYAEVYDGPNDMAKRIGAKMCGTVDDLPSKTFVSTNGRLFLRFRSDDTVNWKGFEATYVLVDPYT